MIVRPCSSCLLRKGCERFSFIAWEFACHRDVDLKSLTAEIKCDWFDRLYSPGARVSVFLHEYQFGDPEYGDYRHVKEGDFPGTISRGPDKKRRITVWMDEDDDVERKIIKVPLSRLTFISDRPPIEVCVCGCPEGEQNDPSWSCDECYKTKEAT